MCWRFESCGEVSKICDGERETGIALWRAQFSCMISNLFWYETA